MNKSLRAKVALAELEAMGLTVDDLVVAAGTDGPAGATTPTVAEYVPVVAAGYKPRTRRTYNSYWSLLVEILGDQHLVRWMRSQTAVTPSSARSSVARLPPVWRGRRRVRG